jgi:hypothetical protein
MKFVFLALLLFPWVTFAQYDAQKLCNERIKLNGGVRSQFGGKSRRYIPLNIPANTKTIVFSISVSENPNMITPYNLTTQLLGAFSGSNVLSLYDAVSGVSGNPGNGILDFYIMNSGPCVDLFISKSTEQCRTLYSRQNSGGGVFQFDVPNTYSTYYLCFRNPDELNEVWFDVEATAIMKETGSIAQPVNSESQQPSLRRSMYQQHNIKN